MEGMATTNEKVRVEVVARGETGKNANRRLRAAGKIPGNVYGLGLDPFAVAVSPRRVEEVLRLGSGRNTVFLLHLAGGEQTRDVMFRELQRDPVTDRLIHVDFVRVDPTKSITVQVPVRLIGTAYGVKNEGAVLDFVQRTVQVSCLASEIPEALEVDISDLHVNQQTAVKDLEIPAGVTIHDDADSILAVVAQSRVEVSEAAAAEGEEEAPAEEAEGEEKGKEAEGEQQQDEGNK